MYAANLPRTSLSKNGVYYYRIRRKDFEARLSLNTKEHHQAVALVYLLEAFRVSEEFKYLSNEDIIIRCNRLVSEQHRALRGGAIRAGVPLPPPEPLPINAFGLMRDEATGRFVPTDMNADDWQEAVKAATAMNEALGTSPMAPPVDASCAPPPLAPPIPMDALIDKYAAAIMGSKRKSGGLRPKTQDERRSMIAKFLRGTAPKTLTPREVTVDAAVAYFFQIRETLSGTRHNSIHVAINSFFEFCLRLRQCFGNPMKMVPRVDKATIENEAAMIERFKEEDLRAIFSHPKFIEQRKGKPGFYWGTILLFLTGARPNEVAQTRLVDFENTDEGWCMNVTDSGETQTVKTRHSRRNVPLHPILGELGFFDWLEKEKRERHSGEQVFPHLTYSKNGHAKNLSRFFNERLLKALEEASALPHTDNVRSLYSFRYTFIQALTERGAHVYVLKPIVGHGDGMLPIETEDDAHGTYSKGYGYISKLKAIMRLPVDCLNVLVPQGTTTAKERKKMTREEFFKTGNQWTKG